MSTNKCCGNCKRYKPLEEIDGMCTLDDYPYDKDYWCDCYKPINNVWTEITPDNVDEIRKNKREIVIINPKEWDVPEMLYRIKADSLVLYSEWGGYYYYVLPELKIE